MSESSKIPDEHLKYLPKGFAYPPEDYNPSEYRPFCEPLQSQPLLRTASRYNQGKTRMGLAPAYAQEQYGKVLTYGANKYDDNNWRKGMSWMSVVDSLERHLNAFKQGEDFDPETGLHHTAHIMCNAAFLTEFYKIAPQYDDRPHAYLRNVKIGLDIDEVIADFVGAWQKRYDVAPEVWNFDSDIKRKFEELQNDKEWWMSIAPKIAPSDIPFEPHCYVTSRSVPSEWTAEWIEANGFPTMPVYSVGDLSKVDAVRNSGCDVFVDDRFENFRDLNRAGVCCFLMDAPHNRRYDVGFKRITSLKQLVCHSNQKSLI